jgi:hypothetical protein
VTTRAKTLFLIGVISLWIISLAVKLRFNGLVYGLDFGLYHPDGQLYSFRALTMSGKSELSAGAIVSDWYRDHSFKLNTFDGSSLYFENNPLWQLYKPRILYPLLSVPFVALIGMPGMLVVPALSMLVLMVCVQLIGFKLENKDLAFFLVTLISVSPVINRWMYANITDGLLTAISSLFVVSLLYVKNHRRFLIIASILITLGSLTRTSVVQWLAICTGLYLINKRRSSIILAVLSLGLFIPSALGNFDNGILPNEKDTSITEQPFQFLASMMRVAYFEIGQLAVLDRLLLILLAITFAVAAMNFSRVSAKFFLLTLLALWITGAINGTIGVNFRYQLPVIPFMIYCLLESFDIKPILKKKITKKPL